MHMKKSFLFLFLLSTLVAFAQEGCDETTGESCKYEGLSYLIYPDTHEAVVDNYNSWTGELEIPSVIVYNGQEYTVTGIKWLAFYQCEELTRVRIPKTIKDIRHYGDEDCTNPFDECTNLEYIEVDEDNPSMCSIEGALFSKDKTHLYCYPAGAKRDTYIVPDGVTWIGGDAFACNSYLVSINMPNSVNHLSFGVFKGCKNLKSVTLSKSIPRIAASTFEKCESMTFLDIPENVTDFEESVFRWTHFEKIVIRGIFSEELRRDTFYRMDDATILYVQPSEIEKFKKVYTGTVLSLEEYIDGIEQVKLRQPSSIIFDLQGRRLNDKPSKGIYIQNGKKVVIK